MVPKMLPKVSNGTHNGTQVVPKFPDTFFQMMIFIIFQVQTMATPDDYFGHNFGYHRKFLGTIDIFFGKHTMSAI